jgi:TIR domain
MQEDDSSQQQEKIKHRKNEHYIEFDKRTITLKKFDYRDLREVNKLFVEPEGYQKFEQLVKQASEAHILVIAGQKHSGKMMTALYLAQRLWPEKALDFYLFGDWKMSLLEIIANEKLPSNAVILFDEVFDRGLIKLDDLFDRYLHLNEYLAALTNVWFIFTVRIGPSLEALQARNFPILHTTGVNCQQVMEKLVDFSLPVEHKWDRADLLAIKEKLNPKLTPSDLRQLFDANALHTQELIGYLTQKEDRGGQTSNTKTVKILYCYARKDKLLRDELEKHLVALERSGQVIAWHDRKILPGTEWKNEIGNQLDTSDIILLLISPNFIQSDYCYSIEMQRALERHRTGVVHVIPIILRPCDWKAMPINALQALPENGKPIANWRNRDGAFQNVVQGIRQVIDAFYFTP